MEIQRRDTGGGGEIADNDPIMGILKAVMLIRQEQNQTTQAVQQLTHEVDRMKSAAAENTEWMTLRGFVARYVVEPIDTSDAGLSRLGAKVSAWHESVGRHFNRKGGFHASYGSVNQYRVKNLHDYFTSSGVLLNEGLLMRDQEERGW